MNAALVELLVPDCKLVNLYTGHVYSYKSRIDDKYIAATLHKEEKWNKYKKVYEIEFEKDVNVAITDVAAADKIPFFNAKGKLKVEVRNTEVVAFKGKRYRIKYLGTNKDGEINFTFIDEEGQDICESDQGFLVHEFAKTENVKGNQVLYVGLEDGAMAEVDSRIAKKMTVQAKTVNDDLIIDRPINENTVTIIQPSELLDHLKKLKFVYKNGQVQTKTSIFTKTSAVILTSEYMTNLSMTDEKEKQRYIDAFNISTQLKLYEMISEYKSEIDTLKLKETIDVTLEEKERTQLNKKRLENQIEECNKQLITLCKDLKSINEPKVS